MGLVTLSGLLHWSKYGANVKGQMERFKRSFLRVWSNGAKFRLSLHHVRVAYGAMPMTQYYAPLLHFICLRGYVVGIILYISSTYQRFQVGAVCSIGAKNSGAKMESGAKFKRKCFDYNHLEKMTFGQKLQKKGF